MKATLMEDSAPDPATAAASSSEKQQRLADIISRARHQRPGALSTITLLGISALLLWCSFTPVDAGPLAWVALAPMLLLTRPLRPTRWMYRSAFAAGLFFWLISLQWMRLGDPTMYIALVALATYLALYWPLSLALIRVAVHRMRIPLVLAAPVVWTGLELLRAHLMTGFAWYNLGHSQYRWIEIIQISDLAGVYAVTFLIAAANAALVLLVPSRWLVKWQLLWPAEEDSPLHRPRLRTQLVSLGACGLLIAASLVYGAFRRLDNFPVGPRVGLVQGNFVASVRNDRDDPRDIYMTHRHLTGLTVEQQPDVIVWPEAMFPYPMYHVEQGTTDEQLQATIPEIPLEAWRGGHTQQALADLADMTDAALIIGASVFVGQPVGYALYNSALLVQPEVGVTARYDKLHRVPFGEYIPLRDQFPFLQSLTPFRGKFGIDRGQQAHAFRYRDWSLIPLICFEDTVPHLVRRIAHEARVNDPDNGACLVNLTNDGWFHGSSELEQHLITASFRAVETRTPLVRAVNTGISAVVDGDGVIRDPLAFWDADAELLGRPAREGLRDPRTGKFYKQFNSAQVVDVPLDPRSSLYVTVGDWLAGACLAGCLAAGLVGCVSSFRRRRLSPEVS